MDYVTDSFTPERLLPNRKLALPLRRNLKNKEHQSWPTLLGGKLYTQKTYKNISCWDEKTLEILFVNDSERFIYGQFSVSNSSFLIGIEKDCGKMICRVSTKTLDILNGFDIKILASSKSIANERYELLYCRFDGEEDGQRPPISLARVDRASSKVVWSFHPKRVVTGHASTNEFVVLHDDKEITALDLNNGEVLWQRPITDYDFLPQRGIQDKGVFIFNDIVVIAIAAHEYIGLDIKSGDLLWKTERGFGGYACVNSDGFLYRINHDFDDNSYWLWQINCRTGEIEKKLQLDLEQFSNDVGARACYTSRVDVTQTHFWLGTGKGLLIAVNLETGDIDWHQNLGCTIERLVICNNRLYTATQDLSQLHLNKLISEMFIFDGVGGYIPD